MTPLFLLLAACAHRGGKDDSPRPGESSPVDSPAESTPLDSPGDSPRDDSHGETDTDTGDTAAVPPTLGFPDLAVTNVIVIEVDTLRADHLSPYGYARETMPLTFARPWRAVTEYDAASSWTLPSTASALTGLEVIHHGMYDTVVDAMTASTAGAYFGADGFATALISGNGFVDGESGLASGFDFAMTTEGGRMDTLGGQLLGWLDGVDGPFFAFLQPMDAHQPYNPDPEDMGTWAASDLPFDDTADLFTQQEQIRDAWYGGDAAARAQLTIDLQDVYDEDLLGLDRDIDSLLTDLDSRGLLDQTLVVITADHGETINDDGSGEFDHGKTVRQELVHVPLLFLAPGIDAGVTSCHSSSMDLVPTLLDLTHQAPVAGLDGASLQDGCRDLTRSFLEKHVNIEWITAATPRARLSRRCISPGTEDLYDLVADPGAVSPVPSGSLADEALLSAELDSFVSEIVALHPDWSCPHE